MTPLERPLDHFDLADNAVIRRYFGKFEKITNSLTKIAAVKHADGEYTKQEIEVLARYLVDLNISFRALAHKYHFSGRYPHAGALTIDRIESGFPVHGELLQMAADAMQVDRHLSSGPDVETLKDQMVRSILSDRQVPTKLQYALSQRLYYEELAKGGLFHARNDPDTVWLGSDENRRRYLIHWAVYDSEVNIPTIYLMDVEDTGRTALPKDQSRWPEVQSHLMAQSVTGLKLLTIAKGFDQDFDELHPKRLRRIHFGPMYSSAYTQQVGPLRQVLEQANSPEGEDWAFVWTEEDLVAERVEEVKSGWFGKVERQIYALDPFGGQGAESGVTRMKRSLIMPERPFQALSELNPPGFGDVNKYVVGRAGRILRY